jgi:hypothetical protein
MTETLTNPPQDDERVIENYYGFSETHRYTLPDGVQWIDYKVMDEGKRSMFQKLTNKDITLRRQSGDASIKVDPAEERKVLLEQSVVDWYMLKPKPGVDHPRKQSDFDPVKFSIGSPGSEFSQWLAKANPKVIDDLEFTIRKANPWMQADMDIEQIDEEISRLTDLRKQVEERQLGESASSSR